MLVRRASDDGLNRYKIVKMNTFFKTTLFTFFSSLFFIVSGQAQSCQCDKVFNTVKMTVENNYAGWFDKVNFDNVKKYLEYSEPFKVSTKSIANDSICAVTINQWMSYFYDKNMRVKYKAKDKNEVMPPPTLEIKDELVVFTIPYYGPNTGALIHDLLLENQKKLFIYLKIWLRNDKNITSNFQLGN